MSLAVEGQLRVLQKEVTALTERVKKLEEVTDALRRQAIDSIAMVQSPAGFKPSKASKLA